MTNKLVPEQELCAGGLPVPDTQKGQPPQVTASDQAKPCRTLTPISCPFPGAHFAPGSQGAAGWERLTQVLSTGPLQAPSSSPVAGGWPHLHPSHIRPPSCRFHRLHGGGSGRSSHWFGANPGGSLGSPLSVQMGTASTSLPAQSSSAFTEGSSGSQHLTHQPW